MHAVDRKDEPAGLQPIRQKLTPKWVRFYRNGDGKKPSDSRWREFLPDLSNVFQGICGYCEEICKGEVDHFRPKSRDPERVYDWSNWVFSCHTCNNQKRDEWSSGGYVDPCAKTRAAQPESYFEFDTKTGELCPKPGLSVRRRKKATQMIDDLGLNLGYHLKKRILWLEIFRKILPDEEAETPNRQREVAQFASRGRPFSSLVRAFLRERGYRFEPE